MTSDTRRNISIRSANKSYGHTTVLDSLDLDVEAGEFLTLLGPSGSGKSTILNVIAGLEPLDEGTVHAGGIDITNKPAHKRGFGMVFQSYALLPHLSVSDNVAYPLRIRHVPRSELRPRVLEALRMVDLEPMADRMPAQLSGGQRQRVSLARALVFRPDVLLMDEPLGALDRNLRHTLQFEIRRLQQEIGATVIYVTHDHDEALSMSDRVALMYGGRIVQIASPRNLYRMPTNDYVAKAFGETSIVPAVAHRLANDPSHFNIDVSGQSIRLASDCVVTGEATQQAAGDDVHQGTLAVRPEGVELRKLDGAATPYEYQGRLVSKVFMGSVWRYEVALGDNTVIATQPSVMEDDLETGMTVGLKLNPESTRFVPLYIAASTNSAA